MKRIISVFLMLICCMSLCGAASLFGDISGEIVMSTENQHIFRYVEAGRLIDLYYSNLNEAKKYDGSYVLVSGRFENGTATTVNIMDSEYQSIVCTFKKGITPDDQSMIAVYGLCRIGSDGIRIVDAEKISSPPSPDKVMSDEVYLALDGSVFDMASAEERSISGGKVKYKISPALAAVESDIKDSGIGYIDGYQYVLNALDNGDNAAESLFVCWFDKSLLDRESDITKRPKEVEQAIVKNISGSVSVPYPKSWFNQYDLTYYRKQYRYYRSKYNTPLDGKGYHAEYIFIPKGSEGMIMLLYVYREPVHLSEVMFVARFLG